jgi:hypothetical protein
LLGVGFGVGVTTGGLVGLLLVDSRVHQHDLTLKLLIVALQGVLLA